MWSRESWQRSSWVEKLGASPFRDIWVPYIKFMMQELHVGFMSLLYFCALLCYFGLESHGIWCNISITYYVTILTRASIVFPFLLSFIQFSLKCFCNSFSYWSLLRPMLYTQNISCFYNLMNYKQFNYSKWQQKSSYMLHIHQIQYWNVAYIHQ